MNLAWSLVGFRKGLAIELLPSRGDERYEDDAGPK